MDGTSPSFLLRYFSFKDFENDCKLVWENALAFNAKGSFVHNMAARLRKAGLHHIASAAARSPRVARAVRCPTCLIMFSEEQFDAHFDNCSAVARKEGATSGLSIGGRQAGGGGADREMGSGRGDGGYVQLDAVLESLADQIVSPPPMRVLTTESPEITAARNAGTRKRKADEEVDRSFSTQVGAAGWTKRAALQIGNGKNVPIVIESLDNDDEGGGREGDRCHHCDNRDDDGNERLRDSSSDSHSASGGLNGGDSNKSDSDDGGGSDYEPTVRRMLEPNNCFVSFHFFHLFNFVSF